MHDGPESACAIPGPPFPFAPAAPDAPPQRTPQVFWTTMLGNFELMSLAFSATLTATRRAMRR